MKNILFLVGFLFSATCSQSFAQELTMQDATLARFTKFRMDTYSAVKWRPGTNDFSHLVDYKELVLCEASSNFKGKTILTKDQLQNALHNYPNTKKANISLEYLPYYHTWINNNQIGFNYSNDSLNYFFVYDLKAKAITAFNYTNVEFEAFETSENYFPISFTNGSIYLLDKIGEAQPIVSTRQKAIVNGSGNVHRQEFGIHKGMFWSPDGTKLAFYHKNETMVKEYPLVNTSTRIAEVAPIRYPMAGETSEEVQLHVYDLKSKSLVKLDTKGPADQFLTGVTWAPNSEDIFIGILNRDQNHLVLKSFSAITGAEKAQLFEEKATTYVEPENALIFEPDLPHGFIYQSEKDGFNALYFVTNDGKKSTYLGIENVVVEEYLGYDKNTDAFYYLGAVNNGLDRQLYSVGLKNGKTNIITQKSGVYAVKLSDDFSKAYFTFSNFNTPTITGILDIKTGKETNLIVGVNPYTKISMPKVEMVKITAADGKTPLNGRIVYPINFDPNKKYPMVLYVYGGPHAQMITNSFYGSVPLWDIHMAQQDYIMFTLDNRGSASRGRDFEHVIHRNLGVAEMADQMKGIEFMKSKPFVDANKIGVYGWSYGGFMTISLLLEHPEVFKVGVAGGPVCDWKYYEVMYGERYMDSPQDNPTGYENASVIKKAKNLRSKLLVIHGAQDDVVVMQHSMEFINACIKAGKQVDYFLYPDHKHNVSGKDRVHLNQKIANYFHDFLK